MGGHAPGLRLLRGKLCPGLACQPLLCTLAMTGHPLPGPLDSPATRSCELAHAQLSPTSAASLSSVNSKRARGAAKLSLSGAPEVLLPGNGIGLAQISGRLETSRAGLEGPTSIRTALGAVLSALE